MKLKTIVCLSLIALVACFIPAAHAQTFSVIHTFAGPAGAEPESGVTIRGNALYGTTPSTCAQQCMVGPGTVYQVAHVGSNWTMTPIYSFAKDWSTGAVPTSRVTFGPDSHLYGTTPYGGNAQNDGVVFSLTPPVSICKTANCVTEKVLHKFAGPPNDGSVPYHSELIFDSAGTIYGVTGSGGTSDDGTVFQMTKSGDVWTETPIHSFNGTDGLGPTGVILDSLGNLFGPTAQGGLHGYGSVFELTYTNGIGWQQTSIYDFQDAADGALPIGPLVQDSAGNLYGSTSTDGSGGGGTVFELSPVGNTWVFTLLHSFSGTFVCGPAQALTLDAAGNLYGTTYCDGASGNGNVFKLTNTPNGWVYTSLYDFGKGADGGWPISNVSIDTDGTLYGTTRFGGNLQGACAPNGCGTVWMIKP